MQSEILGQWEFTVGGANQSSTAVRKTVYDNMLF